MSVKKFLCAILLGGISLSFVHLSSFGQTVSPANVVPASAPPAPTAATPRRPVAEDTLYRIGPGDTLEIRVFGNPEMSKDFRVDNQGRIRPVFIKEELTVACLTEIQVARMLEEKYSKYLRTPMVDVFVKDFQSQPIAVIGAVMQPGRFKLQRRIRLLELLGQAGGVNGNSGTTINLIRSQEYNYCRNPAGMPAPLLVAVPKPDEAANGEKTTDEAFAGQLITLNLRDVLLGTPETNIYVEPGDTISVPDADQVFLVGGVMRPGPIVMRQSLRLSEAVGMAGGFFTDVSKNKITVSRQIAGSTQRETLIVDFEAVEKKKAEDLILRPSDVINVPASTVKGIGRSLLGLIAPTAGQLPLRVLRPY